MRYRVEIGPLRVGPGVILGLTDQQAAGRAHMLNRIDLGFVPTAPVEFKSGEVVEIVSGDVGKAMLAGLVPLDADTPAEYVRPAPPAPARRAR